MRRRSLLQKEPYKRDYILQKRPVILRSLLIGARLILEESRLEELCLHARHNVYQVRLEWDEHLPRQLCDTQGVAEKYHNVVFGDKEVVQGGVES